MTPKQVAKHLGYRSKSTILGFIRSGKMTATTVPAEDGQWTYDVAAGEVERFKSSYKPDPRGRKPGTIVTQE